MAQEPLKIEGYSWNGNDEWGVIWMGKKILECGDYENKEER